MIIGDSGSLFGPPCTGWSKRRKPIPNHQ